MLEQENQSVDNTASGEISFLARADVTGALYTCTAMNTDEPLMGVMTLYVQCKLRLCITSLMIELAVNT